MVTDNSSSSTSIPITNDVTQYCSKMSSLTFLVLHNLNSGLFDHRCTCTTSHSLLTQQQSSCTLTISHSMFLEYFIN